ncbi:ester cyclase [Haloarchaeobius sp. DFWS5]|uniref:ester cyclase n=1 Tax=Haloarchaeobius sp. DFWS5 TaxID=3446114 RepID=UPI003EB71764
MAANDSQLIERYGEILNAIIGGVNEQDLDGLDEYFAPELETEIPYGWSGEYVSNYDEFADLLSTYFEAFPDFSMQAESFTASGEWTFTWVSFAGTHEGDFWGYGPTGESFQTTGFWVNRFEDECITESYGWFDMFDLLCQLGYEFSFED